MKIPSSLAIALAAGLLLAACTKKDEDATPKPTTKQGAIDRALANPQGTAVQAGKGAIVAQECAIACQAKPGIDPGPCTPKCVKDCANENDTTAIDACATRVANEQPPL